MIIVTLAMLSDPSCKVARARAIQYIKEQDRKSPSRFNGSYPLIYKLPMLPLQELIVEEKLAIAEEKAAEEDMCDAVELASSSSSSSSRTPAACQAHHNRRRRQTGKVWQVVSGQVWARDRAESKTGLARLQALERALHNDADMAAHMRRKMIVHQQTDILARLHRTYSSSSSR